MCMGASVSTAGADADDGEVGEVRVEARRVLDGVVNLGGHGGAERHAGAAGLAHGPAAVAAGQRVQAGTVAEVHVLHEADRLERVEVAVDRCEVRRRQLPVQPAGDVVGAHRTFGRVQRLEHEAAGRGDPQAAGAQGAHGSSGGGGRERRPGDGGGHLGERSPRRWSRRLGWMYLRTTRGCGSLAAASQATCGTALSVKAQPTTTITSAETVGSALVRRPGTGSRLIAFEASTTARPRPTSVVARPRLNATISSIPSATWPWAIAPSRTTSAGGHGISPAAAPSASRPRASSRSGGACESECPPWEWEWSPWEWEWSPREWGWPPWEWEW